MTGYTPAQIQNEADKLMAAVNRYAEVCNLQVDGLPIVDAMVICGQRGFNQDGGLSRAFTLVPTETPQYVLMGLIRDAQIEYDRKSWNAYPDTGDEAL